MGYVPTKLGTPFLIIGVVLGVFDPRLTGAVAMTRKPTMCHIIHSCSMHVLIPRLAFVNAPKAKYIHVSCLEGYIFTYLYTLMYHFRFKCTQRITEVLKTSQIADESLRDMLQETP